MSTLQAWNGNVYLWIQSTFTVAASGANYTSVSAALASAATSIGDTLQISAGTYGDYVYSSAVTTTIIDDGSGGKAIAYSAGGGGGFATSGMTRNMIRSLIA